MIFLSTLPNIIEISDKIITAKILDKQNENWYIWSLQDWNQMVGKWWCRWVRMVWLVMKIPGWCHGLKNDYYSSSEDNDEDEWVK